ncbi:unnamed protein product [Cuscuta europaea]|uniref:Uncharacterized protein n=1 Tax=Cuscuta europaea TaxID=41803 RepID=A0A9P0YGM6_CUSEU|nr:unnamed protein product [Cuscuta europaea]
MRESLAGALASVCQRKNGSASNEAKDESESKQGQQQPSEEVNTAGFPELAVDDIPFSDNFFVKDDLLDFVWMWKEAGDVVWIYRKGKRNRKVKGVLYNDH